MKKLSLFGALAGLLFVVGCGSYNNNGGGVLPPPAGGFGPSSLSGQYAYQLTGIDSVSDFREAGVFTADGNGNITSGVDDFAQGTTVTSGSTTGTYIINPNSDGTGTATLNFSDGRALALAITVVSSTKVDLLIASTQLLATGTGVAEKQTTSAFAAPPSGAFVFRMHNVGTGGATGTVGAMTIAGGLVVGGNEDVNTTAAFTSPTLTGGLFNAPDASGHGSGNLTDSSNQTIPFFYYVIDGNTFLLFSTDAGILGRGLGRAEKQSGSFTNATFAGNYVFGSNGDTLISIGTGVDGVNTVGGYKAGGDGTIGLGTYDFVQDGTSFNDIPINSGTYVVDPTGRVAVTLTPSNSANISEVLWMVSPSRAFFVVDDATKVEDGTIDLQQVNSFATTTMNGQFVVVMNGFDPISLVSRVGTLQWDGKGILQLNEFLNRSGTVSIPGLLPGTYSITTAGRATGIISGVSSNIIFYMISGSDGYILQNDASTQIDGFMSKQ